MNPGFRDHFENPRGLGALENPNAVAKHVNPACGDILQFSAFIEDGLIADLRFQCKGCSASIAAASALVSCAKGQAVTDAEEIDQAQLESVIGELPLLSKHGFSLALDAFKRLLAEIGNS